MEFDPYAVVSPPSKEADLFAAAAPPAEAAAAFDPFAPQPPAAAAAPASPAFNPFEETPAPHAPPPAAAPAPSGFEHDFFTSNQDAPPPPQPFVAVASPRQVTGSFDAPPPHQQEVQAAPTAAAAANSSAGATLFDDVSMHRREPVDGAAQERPSKPPAATAEAPWFGARLENVELDDGTMRQFLSRAVPQSAGTLKLNIVRSKAALMSSYASEFRAYVSLDGAPGWRNRGLRFVMCAKREPGLKQGVYTISMSETDLKQHQPTVREMSPFYLGKVGATNVLKTEFIVNDNGPGLTAADEGVVVYVPTNEKKCPRHLMVAVPTVDPETGETSHVHPSGTMMDHFKMKHHANLVVAVSKSPTWNNVTGTFGLAFSGGRVATDSVKNIQLLQQGVQQGDSGANGEKEHSVLEFGKYRGEEFCLDVSYPFSPFTAFAIALTAFDVPSKF